MSVITNQPKALYILSFAQMFEAFSFYGFRALLVLFMMKELNYDMAKAFGIYALFTALSRFSGLIGGFLSDRLIGLRSTMNLGGILITIGHIILFSYHGDRGLYSGLGMIAFGTGIYRTSCTALLGDFYFENDPRRDPAFIFFYSGFNMGALLATVICVIVAEKFSYHAAFLLSAFAMFIGLIGVNLYSKELKTKGISSTSDKNSDFLKALFLTFFFICLSVISVAYYNISSYLIALLICAAFMRVIINLKDFEVNEQKNILKIFGVILVFAIFYAFVEQMGTTITVFAEKFGDANVLGLNIPAPMLNVFNPIAIIFFGPLIAIFLQKITNNKKRKISLLHKLSIAFFIQTIAYLIIFAAPTNSSIKVSSLLIGMTFFTIGIGELFIGPAVKAFCTESAPKNIRATMMGFIMLGSTIAKLLNGLISQVMFSNNSEAVETYQNSFLSISIVTLSFGIILILLSIKSSKKSNLKFHHSEA